MSTIALNPDFSRTWNYGVGRSHNSPCQTSMSAMMMMMNSARKGKDEWLGKSAKLSINNRRPFTLNVKFRSEDEDDYMDMVPFEAEHDEEFQAASKLKVECLFEVDENTTENGETLKRMYTLREFNTLKERWEQRKCYVMFNKEDGIRNMVATLYMHVEFVSDHPQPKKLERIRYGYISFLYVAKSARRQGIATTMVKHAISSARDLGLERVFLKVEEDNKAAIALYEKIGFQVVKPESNTYFESSSSAQALAVAQPLVMCFQFSQP